ncbi:anthranilate phosphoribosyltransferase [Candidatus Sumerlaeota bacterium]|nr:anthranilate phosphoribosyltransferase [Candidatus Sumerlaeota bacterium]
MNAIQQAISNLTLGEEVNDQLAIRVASEILTGEATPGQIGSFLTALRIRGEQPHHILAFARAMRGRATPIEISERDGLVDTCGTGGDSSGTFNISTAAALIAAGAGARVARPGNRAMSGKCGSADVLKALGVNIEMTPERAAQCVEEAGCAFLFAPVFHGAMKHAGPVRREIGIRTIFNMLGPLSNPAGATRQLIGVYDKHLTSIFAKVLSELGSRRVMIVHGSDGLDEITLTGPTDVSEALNGVVINYPITPEEFGLERANPRELLGGGVEENAAIIRAILAGEKGPKRTIAELNAAAALVVADRAGTISEGLLLAREAVDSGAAAGVGKKLVEISNRK